MGPAHLITELQSALRLQNICWDGDDDASDVLNDLVNDVVVVVIADDAVQARAQAVYDLKKLVGKTIMSSHSEPTVTDCFSIKKVEND